MRTRTAGDSSTRPTSPRSSAPQERRSSHCAARNRRWATASSWACPGGTMSLTNTPSRSPTIAVRLDTAVLFDDVRALATSQERNRIAREMHDGVAQEIVGLGFLVDEIESVTDHTHLEDRSQLPGLGWSLTDSISSTRNPSPTISCATPSCISRAIRLRSWMWRTRGCRRRARPCRVAPRTRRPPRGRARQAHGSTGGCRRGRSSPVSAARRAVRRPPRRGALGPGRWISSIRVEVFAAVERPEAVVGVHDEHGRASTAGGLLHRGVEVDGQRGGVEPEVAELASWWTRSISWWAAA